MFTTAQLNLLLQALDLAQKSNTRAMNNSKSPEFTPIYTKIDKEMAEVKLILQNALTAPQKSK